MQSTTIINSAPSARTAGNARSLGDDMLHSDFARGQRLLTREIVTAGDFAAGQRRSPATAMVGTFATGMRSTPMSAAVGDFATGMRTVRATPEIVQDAADVRATVALAA